MSRSLSIKGKTQANTALTTTINYVNPNATDEQLVSLATAFNGLTTNTLGDISKIDKESLTNVVPKLPRNARLVNATEQPITEINVNDIPTDMTRAFDATILYDSDDTTDTILDRFTQITLPGENPQDMIFTTPVRYEDQYTQKIKGITVYIARPGSITEPITLHFEIGATNKYQAATIDIPIVL